VTHACSDLFDPERTMLGTTQERWLADGLRQTPERWNVVAEATLVAPAGVGEGDDRLFWTDAWDGYPAARDRLLAAVADAGARSCLMVSGDAHTNYIADLQHGGSIAATEFCGTSITSQGRPQAQTDAIRAANPHIHLANSQRRGYVVFDVERDEVRARLRVVGDVRDRATGVETLATFTVAAGRPGAQRA
jgi:alkaline phosphatase D